jgi:hypothetical protein
MSKFCEFRYLLFRCLKFRPTAKKLWVWVPDHRTFLIRMRISSGNFINFQNSHIILVLEGEGDGGGKKQSEKR